MLANTPQLASPLFVITDPTRLWIQIDVPERDQGRVRLEQSFEIKSRSLPAQTFTGKVEFISDSLDPTTRTIKVRGSVPNAQRLLKAEMFVKAEFLLAPESGCGGIKPCRVPARRKALCDAGRHTWPLFAPGSYRGQRTRGPLDRNRRAEAGAACRCGWRFVARTTSQPIV